MFRIKPFTLIILSAALAAHAAVQAKPANGACLRQPGSLLAREQQKSKLQDENSANVARGQDRLIREIRHELVTLPYYDVFDWLEGEVRPDGTVVLRGEVVRPSTKSDAEARIKKIEGVERVINEIEVLPVSPNDDRIRLAVYRALFNWDSPLFRYAHRSVPPIHIIVKNGRVWLRGVVANEQESQIAYMKARSVPGVFEVTNELRVEK
jgi:hyperosmotically inducible protein